jgi:hypothetical protein
MKKIFIFILIFFFSGLAFADCDIEQSIGKNISNFPSLLKINQNKTDEKNNLIVKKITFPFVEICKQKKLGNISAEYTFVENRLAEITLTVVNDKDNTESNKLLLFNYVRSVYGTLPKGLDSNLWTGYKIWDRNKIFIIYKKKRLLDNILDEVLFVGGKEFEEKLLAYRLNEEEKITKSESKKQ